MPTFIPIGLGAGLAVAVLFASASTGPLLTRFLLFFLAPLPAFLAGLGWGWLAAVIAGISGTLLVAVVSSPLAALLYGASQGIPVAILCYLAYLNRTVTDPTSGATHAEWFPIGRLVVWAAVMAGVLAGLSLFIIGSDPGALRTSLRAFIERVVARELPQLGDKPLDASQLDALTDLAMYMLPAASAISWLSGLLVNLYLAGRITLASGRLPRPWPDLAAVSYPAGTALVLAVMLGSTFLAGATGLVAAGFAGALLMIYVLLGLAIVHFNSRGKPIRPLILASVYAGLVFLNTWAALGLALFALAEPYAPWRRNRSPPPAAPPPATT